MNFATSQINATVLLIAWSDDPLTGDWLEFALDALQVLTHQPGISQPVEGSLRELIIAHRRSGYLARYEFDDG